MRCSADFSKLSIFLGVGDVFCVLANTLQTKQRTNRASQPLGSGHSGKMAFEVRNFGWRAAAACAARPADTDPQTQVAEQA